jgi:ribose/xylose/arabinose/galactoside ABC-type transport system permease subunit
LIGATTTSSHCALTLKNLQEALLDVLVIGLLTAGMTIAIVIARIDLSVAFMLGISAYLTGSLFTHIQVTSVRVAGTHRDRDRGG